MKNLNIIILIINCAMVLFSCATTEREKVVKKAYKESNKAQKMIKRATTERPDFNAMLFSNKEINYSKFSVESSRVFPKDDCEIVNLNVYYLDDFGTKFLVANDNIIVNECSQRENSTGCSGILSDGNLVLQTKRENDVCLYTILTKDKYINSLYTISINNLLATKTLINS